MIPGLLGGLIIWAFGLNDYSPTTHSKAKYSRWNEIMGLYSLEYDDFKVTTEDGYILTLFRISGRYNDSEFREYHQEKGAVLIMHGNFVDAAQWMTHYP